MASPYPLAQQTPQRRLEPSGTLDYLKELADYWREHFDWRVWEAELDAYPQFMTKHLLLARLEREEPDPTAVLLTRLKIDRTDVHTRVASL